MTDSHLPNHPLLTIEVVLAPTEDSVDAGLLPLHVESLGENVSQLLRSRDLDQLHLSFPDHFVSKVLADVNVHARSRPQMMLFPLSMHTVLSTYIGVGVF